MRHGLLTAGRFVLLVANGLNWLAAGLLALGTGASVPLAGMLLHRLAVKYPGLDAETVLWTMRGIAMLSLPVAIALHLVFTRLVAIVDTARAGDPFVIGNAARLRTIGWALLAVQVADLTLGAISGWLAHLHVDRLDWSPSFTGWIAVLMVFVLARVFSIGAAMRDELEHTV